MRLTKHFDEARRDGAESLRAILGRDPTIERAVLIDDLLGKVRAVVWPSTTSAQDLRNRIALALAEAAGPFWSGDVWIAPGTSEAERLVYDRAWGEGLAITPNLRLCDRHRTKGSWLQPILEPPWPVETPEGKSATPIIAFYSFKGGVGRTTTLAAFAIQRARAGERVAVLDLDLDAPGVGSLLSPGPDDTGARWGIVDYLLERPVGEVDLRDYYHACAREAVAGTGEILVVPAGYLDDNYLGKLGRVDMEPPHPDLPHPLRLLLDQVRTELDPRWVLIDARAGLSEPAGLLVGGLAHMSVLFGTMSEQSWLGLRLVVERLGAERIRRQQPQAECLVVQAMVPSIPGGTAPLEARFSERARAEFTEHYYVEDTGDSLDDEFWSVRELEDQDAPHVPVPLHYEPLLATFSAIDEVADLLAESTDYVRLGSRIVSRFTGGPE